MRIVFVQAGFGAGGAEKIVSLLARHRAELGDEVHVLGFHRPSGGSYFPYPASVHIATPEATDDARQSGIVRVIRRLRWLRRQLVALRPDLVVSFLTKTNVVALLASRGLAVPVVVSERNNPGRQQAHWLWKPASMALAQAAAGVVMQTKAARDSLPRGLRARAVVIPNPCVPIEQTRRPAGDGSRIIAVGRLVRQKGFDLLLQAFARLAADAPDATLTIFGDGPERRALEKQARALRIDDRVSLPGTTPSPGAWLAAGDIFVLSSRFEGFPNVLVEALAAGFAAIAFDCPWGPSDILTDQQNGLLVPPEDVDALARALLRLTRDAALRSALRKAAPAAADRYALPGVLVRWDAVFAEASGHAASLPENGGNQGLTEMSAEGQRRPH